MKKQTHITLIFCDLFGLLILWIGYSDIQLLQQEISNQVNVVEFGNRIGFVTISVAFPLFHIMALVSHFWKGMPKKYTTLLNTSVYILLAVLIIAGFVCSSWLESKVENAGYVYCWRASGSGAISKVLVYTKDMKICEELVEEQDRRRRTGKWE